MKKIILILSTSIFLICFSTYVSFAQNQNQANYDEALAQKQQTQAEHRNAVDRKRTAYQNYMNAIKNSSSQEIREKARQEYLKASADEEIARSRVDKNFVSKYKSNYKVPDQWHKKLDKSYNKGHFNKMFRDSIKSNGQMR